VVHIVVADNIVDHYCLMFHRGGVLIVVAGYIVDHLISNSNGQQYNSHNNINYSSVNDNTAMVNNITSHSNMNRSSVKHETVMVNNITSYNNMNHSSVGWLYC
jgi:hypothetical protein